MNILYNILIEFIDKILLPILSIFSGRISRFLKVRENLFQVIDKDIDSCLLYTSDAADDP